MPTTRHADNTMPPEHRAYSSCGSHAYSDDATAILILLLLPPLLLPLAFVLSLLRVHVNILLEHGLCVDDSSC
jgi:hypothetical protein